MKKYALISVSDKTGIDNLAKELISIGFEIISTGGTAKFLTDKGLHIIQITDWTGFPEILDGRVKTLHPKVHGGILADRDIEEHHNVLQEHEIKPIEMVVVNLYPFEKTAANPASTEEEIIENIDIGGPTLIRSAAKNFKHVIILTEKQEYAAVITQLKETGTTSLNLRKKLAHKAFAQVECYDRAISTYFSKSLKAKEVPSDDEAEPILHELNIQAPLVQSMRYGENPHQQAGYFSNTTRGWTTLHGKPLSYNNLLDLDAALKAIMLFEQPTAMIFKHTNPCGIGSGTNLTDAYQKAFETDPLSPFGGIIIVNRALDLATVTKINEIFSEIIIAPAYETDALETLKKRKDRRLVSFDPALLKSERSEYEVRSIISGYLLQGWDDAIASEQDWQIVTERKPNPDEMDALRFAWRAVSILKSNAIALCAKDRTLGLGTGQASRIDSTEIAINKALHFGHNLTQAVCASDGFFPFRDSVELLSKHGIKAVIQPGGSKGDADVIAACDELGISMVMTGLRHFRH
ncbi:MAG: bifunctional phosphoribosylaminoimidazolecarboxamide formyltransferase/IMP cyclohydrolase [Candidatus Cloacimonadaceae bacterium]